MGRSQNVLLGLASFSFIACGVGAFVSGPATKNSMGQVGSHKLKDSGESDDMAFTPKSFFADPFAFAVLRLKATEPRFSSRLNGEKRPGSYACAGCGLLLFKSEDKYESGSGWPAFTRPAEASSVVPKLEWGGRVEVTCARCGGHQGHAFPDGPSPAKGGTGKRFCINGCALNFVALESELE